MYLNDWDLSNIPLTDRQWVLSRASKFFLNHRRLFKHHEPNGQRVLLDAEHQEAMLVALHNELGHRGRSKTYRCLLERAQCLVSRTLFKPGLAHVMLSNDVG